MLKMKNFTGFYITLFLLYYPTNSYKNLKVIKKYCECVKIMSQCHIFIIGNLYYSNF